MLRLLRPEVEAADLAGFIMTAWQGTHLHMNVERSPAPIDRFRAMLARLIDGDRPRP